MIVADTSGIVAMAFASEWSGMKSLVRAVERADRTSAGRPLGRHGARMAVGPRPAACSLAAVGAGGRLLRLPMFEIVPPDPSEMDAAYAASWPFDMGQRAGKTSSRTSATCSGYALTKGARVALCRGQRLLETDIASALGA